MPTTLKDLEPRVDEVVLHGHKVSYRTAGEGPVVLLIHGITGNSEQWNDVIPLLAEHYTVVAPDLLGHGQSAKPRGDYSLGAYAVGIRDLMIVLGHRRATVVGHSLGGGVAMQFSYEYPVFCERLVLVSSGGLGHAVHPLLRAATLPGSELVLPVIANRRILSTGFAFSQILGRLGVKAGSDLTEMARGYASLGDAEARSAFIHTVRAVMDRSGQRVSANDRLYLASMMPSLIVWGERDPLIPARHGRAAHEAMPGSWFELFEGAGHFAFLDEPIRFAGLLHDFIESTEAAAYDFSDADLGMMRDLMIENAQASGGATSVPRIAPAGSSARRRARSKAASPRKDGARRQAGRSRQAP